MLQRGGMPNLVGLLRDIGAGQPFEGAFRIRYDRELSRLDEELRSELSHR
jgi:hypothetical protein